MLNRWLTICDVGEIQRTKQKIMHLLLQEKMNHSDFVYVNLHLDKYDVRTLKPQYECRDTENILYENIFDLYQSRLDRTENNAMSLMNFAKKYEERKGKIIEQTKRTVVVAFPSWSSDPS